MEHDAATRAALLARGRQVLERRRRSSVSTTGGTPPMTPATSTKPAFAFAAAAAAGPAIGSAQDLLSRAVSTGGGEFESDLNHARKEESNELLELASCLYALLCPQEHTGASSCLVANSADSDSVRILAARLVPQATRLCEQLEALQQQRHAAERAASDAQAEAAQVIRKIELYKKQLQLSAESTESVASAAAERAAADGVEAVARVRAERDELRQSLGACIDKLASEKEAAEKRASVAEAALRLDADGGYANGGGGGGGDEVRRAVHVHGTRHTASSQRPAALSALPICLSLCLRG